MKFELEPILSVMDELYGKPISVERFQEYLTKLKGGTKGDLKLPISGFNPMAKDHVKQKINELQQIEAEEITQEVVDRLNQAFKNTGNQTIKVVINLADDQKGGWTNHYTTDFDSKFKINALVERHFCTPHFWTSEGYSVELIKHRVLAYCYRTIFWLQNGKILTLNDYIKQEVYVAKSLGESTSIDGSIAFLKQFHEKHKESDEYSILFNFFYGDEASQSLGYSCYGIQDINGFDYAHELAKR